MGIIRAARLIQKRAGSRDGGKRGGIGGGGARFLAPICPADVDYQSNQPHRHGDGQGHEERRLASPAANSAATRLLHYPTIYAWREDGKVLERPPRHYCQKLTSGLQAPIRRHASA